MAKAKTAEKTEETSVVTPLRGGSSALADRAAGLLRSLGDIEEISGIVRALTRQADDIREIAYKDKVLVKEERCIRCGRAEGDTHSLGACASSARIEEIRARLDQPETGGSE